jgi:hypothetical protein
MSVELVRFRPEHIALIPCTQPGLQPMHPAHVVGDLGPAFTLLDDDRPVGAGGLIRLGQSTAMAWAWIGPCGPALFRRIHHITLQAFDHFRFRRIEAVVRQDWPPGHRWARLLGFCLVQETMSAYLPGGARATLYVRER